MLAGHDVRSLDLEIYQKTMRNVYAEVKPRALMNTELYVRPLNYHVANSVQSELLETCETRYKWSLFLSGENCAHTHAGRFQRLQTKNGRYSWYAV